MVSLPSTILSTSFLASVKRTRPLYNVGRRARFALGSQLGARYVEGLGSRAHYNDAMLSSTANGHVERYRRDAIAFVDILGGALKQAGRDWTDVWACLDVGCGYGRIVREVCKKVPAHTISVCDLVDEGARFAAAEFGVRKVPIIEMMGPDRNRSFDLVYLLSVYTQLDRPMIEMNLAKVAALTKPEGVVVFTTQAEPSAAVVDRFGLDRTKLDAALHRFGFAHARPPYSRPEDGLTWIVVDEVKTLVQGFAPELEFVAHHPKAVDGVQDVFVYRKP